MNEKDYLVLFGKNLKCLRREQHISQEKLAERSKLDRTFVSVLERGHKAPSLNTIFKLAVALQVHPKVLLDFDY